MARHIPHVFCAAPWVETPLSLSDSQIRHLHRVLRLQKGDLISYTDGLGTLGSGRLGPGEIVRGHENTIPRPSTVAMAVAPLKSTDRTRLIVEKLQELGVASLWWLTSEHTQGSAPKDDKAKSWAISALEQSRGAWLMELAGPHTLDERSQLMDGGGSAALDPTATLCVGPEGGWSPAEVGDGSRLVQLGPTVLRTETAAVVAACRAIEQGRSV